MNVKIEESWKQHIGEEFDKQYFVDLTNFVKEEYLRTPCYPPGRLIFNAFNLCPFDDVKVVIIGQDPYHEPGQAMGLSFSVPDGITFPPSLINIFKEIQMDLGTPMPATGDLTRWAKQGVLLLNATLTVRAHQAASHQRKGWEEFTDAAIKALSKDKEHLVFILWGGYARSKAKLIDTSKHLILESVHPSPLSANRGGWFGNHHSPAAMRICSRTELRLSNGRYTYQYIAIHSWVAIIIFIIHSKKFIHLKNIMKKDELRILQVGNVLVSPDIITEKFCCDLDACKGECCIEGDAGAPVTLDEIMEIEDALDVVWDDLSASAQAIIDKQGVAYTDIEGDLVTSIVNGKDCVFTCYQDLKDLGDGHTIPNCCLCALERAYREGKSKFKKPISCALYPIRAKDFGNEVYGINYNKWRICKDAIKKGEELNLPVYKFLEGPLIEKFGKEWYDELCEVAEQLLADLED